MYTVSDFDIFSMITYELTPRFMFIRKRAIFTAIIFFFIFTDVDNLDTVLVYSGWRLVYIKQLFLYCQIYLDFLKIFTISVFRSISILRQRKLVYAIIIYVVFFMSYHLLTTILKKTQNYLSLNTVS